MDPEPLPSQRRRDPWELEKNVSTLRCRIPIPPCLWFIGRLETHVFGQALWTTFEARAAWPSSNFTLYYVSGHPKAF